MGRRGGVIGIDYSMTSPSVCVFQNKQFTFDNCKFYFLTDKKKFEIKTKAIEGQLFDEYTSTQQRFDNISNWVVNIVNKYQPLNVYLEDYSFGSTGRVFNIAENAGLLKHKLWTLKVNFSTIPPTVVKKFASGKGNADKSKMQEAFIAETGVDVKKLLGLTDNQWNPSSDIIDSYFICKYGYDQTLHSTK